MQLVNTLGPGQNVDFIRLAQPITWTNDEHDLVQWHI